MSDTSVMFSSGVRLFPWSFSVCVRFMRKLSFSSTLYQILLSFVICDSSVIFFGSDISANFLLESDSSVLFLICANYINGFFIVYDQMILGFSLFVSDSSGNFPNCVRFICDFSYLCQIYLGIFYLCLFLPGIVYPIKLKL